VTTGVNGRRPRQHNTVQGLGRTELSGEAVTFVDATDIPLATEHGVVHAVLVDPGAKAGRAHGECHGADYRFAHTIVTRKVVELGLLPQRAPFASGTSG
jgi:hypothetical protein